MAVDGFARRQIEALRQEVAALRDQVATFDFVIEALTARIVMLEEQVFPPTPPPNPPPPPEPPPPQPEPADPVYVLIGPFRNL